MVPDCRHAGGMTDRSDNSTFLLPGMHAAEEIDGTIVDLDPQSLGFAICSLLQRAFNLFSQFHWIYCFRSNLNLIGYSDDTFKPQHGLLGILTLTPEIHIALKGHPSVGYR